MVGRSSFYRGEAPMRARLICLAAICTTIVALVPATAMASGRGPGCHSRSCVERVARHHCGAGDVHACIRRGAMRWRVSYSLLHSIIRCESGFDPRAYNKSGATGLGQVMPGTWRGTPYAARSAWSAKWNALASAWLLRQRGTVPWVSSIGCWG